MRVGVSRSRRVTLCVAGPVAMAVLLLGCARPAAQPRSTRAAIVPSHSTTEAMPMPVIQSEASSTRPRRPRSLKSPRAAHCVSGQLDGRFVGGGFGMGNDFGELLIWNPSNRPCSLQGPVTFAAHYADGSVDRNATVNRPISRKASKLPRRMAAPRDGQGRSRYVVVSLMGPERDDPTRPNGGCRAQDEAHPATLRVHIGQVTIGANNNDAMAAQVSSIYGCHGAILLEGVAGPAG